MTVNFKTKYNPTARPINRRAHEARDRLSAKVRRLGYTPRDLEDEARELGLALRYTDFSSLTRIDPDLSLRKIPLAAIVVQSLHAKRRKPLVVTGVEGER